MIPRKIVKMINNPLRYESIERPIRKKGKTFVCIGIILVLLGLVFNHYHNSLEDEYAENWDKIMKDNSIVFRDEKKVERNEEIEKKWNNTLYKWCLKWFAVGIASGIPLIIIGISFSFFHIEGNPEKEKDKAYCSNCGEYVDAEGENAVDSGSASIIDEHNDNDADWDNDT